MSGLHQGLDNTLTSQRQYRIAGHVHGQPVIVRAQGAPVLHPPRPANRSIALVMEFLFEGLFDMVRSIFQLMDLQMAEMSFFGDPVWWVSVVVVGILINFFSAYAKGWLDSGLSKVSEKWRRSSDKRKNAQLKKVEELAASEYARLKAMSVVTHSLIRAVSFQVLAFIGMYLAVVTEKTFTNLISLGIGAGAIFCLAMSMATLLMVTGVKKNVDAADRLNASK